MAFDKLLSRILVNLTEKERRESPAEGNHLQERMSKKLSRAMDELDLDSEPDFEKVYYTVSSRYKKFKMLDMTCIP